MVVCYAKDIVKVDDRRISELSDAPLDMDWDSYAIES
jgi:hypothetical protein